MVREILLLKWLYHIFQSIMFGKYSKYKTISPNMWYWTIPHVSWNVWYCSIPHVWRNCHIFELISPVLQEKNSVLDLEFYAITFWQKKSYLSEPEVAILIFRQTCGIDQYHMFRKTYGIEQYHMFGEISHVLQEKSQWLDWIFVHITGMLIQWL